MTGPSEVRSIWGAFTIIDRISGPLRSIQAAMGGVKDNLATTAAAFDRLQNYMEKHAEVLGVIGGEIAYISSVTKNFMVDSAREASSEMAMMNYLTQQYGNGAEAYVLRLQKLSGGIYDSGQIMSKVNYATSMGVDYDNMGTLVAGSRALAKMRGGNADEIMDKLIYGLTSPDGARQLRRAGVEIDETEALQKYAAAARDHGAVTQDQVKTYAMQAAVMDELNKKIDQADLKNLTLDESTKALNVSWSELGQELARGVLPILQVFTNMLTAIVNIIRIIPTPILALAGILIFLASIFGVVTGAVMLQGFALNILAKQHVTLGEAVTISAGAYANFGAFLTASIAPEVSATFATYGLAAGIGALLVELLPVIVALGALLLAILYIQDAMNKSSLEETAFYKDVMKLRDALDAIWQNPIGKAILSGMAPPVAAGMAARDGFAQGQQLMVNVHIPEIKTEALSKEELQTTIANGVAAAADPLMRLLKLDLKGAGSR